MKKIELLSPAGDLERLRVTLLYGADAVYIGGKEYSMRANANNFSLDEIREACTFAHFLGKKVYLTLNIVFHNEDLVGVEDYIKKVVDCGIDAFIVSDPFIISYIKSNYDVEVHLSTQASTTNVEAVKYYMSEGVDRVVLARELSIPEIKEIIDETGIDIEIFIHGAMCTFYSGRCVLSNYVTNRDSNRGGCAQVCRFAFDNDVTVNKFTMATKDLNTSHLIKDLISIGVRSLKVEGRMRSLYYLATVVGTYRKIIDGIYDNTLTDELMTNYSNTLSRVANRLTSTHYLEKKADFNDQYYTGRQELSNQDFLGIITDYDSDNKVITLTQRNYFEKGDKVVLFTPSGKEYSFVINDVYDSDMNNIGVARHPEEIIKIKIDFCYEFEEYSMMRKVV